VLEPSQPVSRESAVETFAWTLLQRYGVVFRRLVHKDPAAPPWRELAAMYRRLEARGVIRGGRFVGGMAGEQFALTDAVEQLREVRRTRPDGQLVTLCAADPLNLTGIVTPGDRVRATPANRVVYRDGVPVAAMEGDMLRSLSPLEPSAAREAAAAAAGRTVPVTSGYVGRLT
jgi:ATP-dependent Lhr-like helicase